MTTGLKGGVYRVLAHTAIGALSGGANGAIGAGATSLSAPFLAKATQSMPTGSKDAVGAALAAAIGATGGGSSGITAAVNEETNNRQLHPEDRQWAKLNAENFAQYYEEKTDRSISIEEVYQLLLSADY